jgi:tetratricopeptide (TPR) repeat protein
MYARFMKPLLTSLCLTVLVALTVGAPAHAGNATAVNPAVAETEHRSPAVIACFRRAKALTVKGDRNGAIAAYTEAILLDQSFAAAYTNRGALLSEDPGWAQGAITDHREAIRANPRCACAFNNLGCSLEAFGYFDGAIENYTRAIELEPKLAVPCLNRSPLADRSGDRKGSSADLIQARTLDPVGVSAYRRRAGLACLLGDKAAACDCDEAIGLEATSPYPYANRGYVRSKLGDQRGADDDFNRAIDLAPRNAWIYWKRGAMRQNRNDVDGALSDYSRAISLDPWLADAYCGRGNMRLRSGDRVGAMCDFDHCIWLDPGNVFCCVDRGFEKVIAGDMAGALKDFDRCIRLQPGHASNYLARIGNKHNAADGDLDDQNRAIDLSSIYADAYYFRALCRSRLGDKLVAIGDYKMAVSLDSKYSNCHIAGLLMWSKVDFIDAAVSNFVEALTHAHTGPLPKTLTKRPFWEFL